MHFPHRTVSLPQGTPLEALEIGQETCFPDVWPHLDIAKTLAMQLEVLLFAQRQPEMGYLVGACWTQKRGNV